MKIVTMKFNLLTIAKMMYGYVIWDLEYPDTLNFGHFSSPALNSQTSKVMSNSSNSYALLIRDCWELYFDDIISSDTLLVYVFDAEIIDNVPWDSIVLDYMVLKRYDLSLENLKKMDWIIPYPN